MKSIGDIYSNIVSNYNIFARNLFLIQIYSIYLLDFKFDIFSIFLILLGDILSLSSFNALFISRRK